MMKDLSSSIETLTKKTEALVQAYGKRVQDIQVLEQEKVRLEGKVSGLNEEVQRLQEENKVLRMASAIKGDEEKVTESKRRISQLVREIDRCIALLND
jgi:uncharacterized protein YoxC